MPFELSVEGIALLLEGIEGVHGRTDGSKQALLGTVTRGKIVRVACIMRGVGGGEIAMFSRRQ
jgi:hypothetical protein